MHCSVSSLRFAERKVKDSFSEVSSSVSELLDELFTMKKTLILNNDTFAESIRDKKLLQSSINQDTTDDSKESRKQVTDLASWSEFRSIEDDLSKKMDEVIDRWNSKTTLTSGITMQKTFKAINKLPTNLSTHFTVCIKVGITSHCSIPSPPLLSLFRSVLNQVSSLLADKERLIKRTQLKRSAAKVLGESINPKKRVRSLFSFIE